MKKTIYSKPSISYVAIASTSIIAASGLRTSITSAEDTVQKSIDTKGMLGFSK